MPALETIKSLTSSTNHYDTTMQKLITNLPSLTSTPAAPVLPVAVLSLLALKGQIVTLTTSREMKYRKDAGSVSKTLKISKFQCKSGVNYENISAVKEKRKSGELPTENAGLNSGMEWVQFPYVLRGIKSGKYQFRCTKHNGNSTITIFVREGKEITREEAMVGTLASEQPNDTPSDVFNISIDNLTHINGQGV